MGIWSQVMLIKGEEWIVLLSSGGFAVICTQLSRSESWMWRERPCPRGAGMTVGDRTCREVEIGPGRPDMPALMHQGLKDTGRTGLSFSSHTQHSGVTLQGIRCSELLLVWEGYTKQGIFFRPSAMFPREPGLPFVETLAEKA